MQVPFKMAPYKIRVVCAMAEKGLSTLKLNKRRLAILNDCDIPEKQLQKLLSESQNI